MSLFLPGMRDTSTSVCELEMSKHNFSMKRAIGICVVKSLLEIASAPVLSERVGTLIGIREPGKELTAMYTKAICANASKAECLSEDRHA